MLMVGQQAIMDAYLCLLHLTAGIVVGECGYQVQCSVAPVGRISPSYFSHAPTDHGHSLCSASFWKLEVPSSSSLNHAGAESLFNAFATAAFFKFVIFSIFEMRYLLAIWKARRPAQAAESWDLMRRDLSILYSRFCECSCVTARWWSGLQSFVC